MRSFSLLIKVSVVTLMAIEGRMFTPAHHGADCKRDAREDEEREETGKKTIPSGIKHEMDRAGLCGKREGRATLGF